MDPSDSFVIKTGFSLHILVQNKCNFIPLREESCLSVAANTDMNTVWDPITGMSLCPLYVHLRVVLCRLFTRTKRSMIRKIPPFSIEVDVDCAVWDVNDDAEMVTDAETKNRADERREESSLPVAAGVIENLGLLTAWEPLNVRCTYRIKSLGRTSD